MSVFPGFGGWINQNIQQPPKAESRRSKNVKSNSVSEKDTNNEEGLNYDEEETKRQNELWKAAEKKHPWYDAPPKVTTKKGLCHMNIEMTLGLTPDGVYELLWT
ncbi:hypothetical protein AT1G23645 [Arabidopsis thaliana]|uniref:Uncharacterized protein n=1 Tax=Arabidopsis thaliana TaxID=3702 RepID=A0A1P8AW06_ARATH|nr:uncharacterized protein AT1G23645 [Arabidopsis thaliana]ANM60871.1 hypothetical protein AT1G23645 [Arabidopsis thaliana]|eukprot:NP_001323122.1 hypothetical protein AT1G23645 [Arabidopsis thaliana]